MTEDNPRRLKGASATLRGMTESELMGLLESGVMREVEHGDGDTFLMDTRVLLLTPEQGRELLDSPTVSSFCAEIDAGRAAGRSMGL